MPNLKITREEAVATTANLKWMSAVNANGLIVSVVAFWAALYRPVYAK